MSTCSGCSTADVSLHVHHFGDVGPDPDPRSPVVLELCSDCHPYLRGTDDPPRDNPPAEHDTYGLICGREKADGGVCSVGVTLP